MTLSSTNIIKGLLVLIAFSLQIQITLFKSADYIGLRVNITDLLLPFIGLFILFSLLSKKTHWPKFPIKGVYFWLIGLGSILIAALINSYISFGEISSWGLQNKVIGWAVICGLFLMGSWLGQNTSKQSILLFFKVMAVFLLLITLIQLGFQVALFSFGFRPITNEFTSYPIETFMANKNSFMFLFLCLIGFLSCLNDRNKDSWIVFLKNSFWFLLPICFLYTGARSVIIILPFIIFALLAFNKKTKWKNIVLFLLCGVISSIILDKTSYIQINTTSAYHTESLSHIDEIVAGNQLNQVADEIAYHGDSNRLNILHHVFGMIKERPLLGSGLGSVLITQVRDNGAYIDLMDCTILWLWAETGLIGLSFFLIFYFLCAYALWKKTREPDGNEFTQDFCRGALVMLVIFGTMSLFHELLYTRFLWVFLGMALTLPLKKKA